MEAGVDPARKHHDADVRSLHSTVVVHDGLRLHGPKLEQAGLEIRSGAPPSTKIRVEHLVARIEAVRVSTLGIGLPDLEERVANRRTTTIEYPAFDGDSLPDRILGNEVVTEVVLEYLEARLLRRQADVDVRAAGLRRRFGKVKIGSVQLQLSSRLIFDASDMTSRPRYL